MKQSNIGTKRLLKALAAVLVAMALLIPALALGEARFPADRGAVTDDANVLSQAMIKEIGEFQTLALARTGVRVRVAVVHFLDGLDAQTYARELFVRWGMGLMDLLILGAAGEDSFAAVSGAEFEQTISDNNIQLLLSNSGFGELFKAQQYETAFGKLFAALAQTLGKHYGADMDLGSLFAAYRSGAQATPKPSRPNVSSYVSSLWDSVMDDIDDKVEGYASYHERRERESRGLTPAGWVLLFILIGLVFSRSDRARRGRGCGCGPLGWIFGLLGLNSLFGRRRG
ncbi:MAG: TPM domain-containing protein [Clostridiales bacterium]|nr:TPM domain-containing protein [Clostridiales bacterium]